MGPHVSFTPCSLQQGALLHNKDADGRVMCGNAVCASTPLKAWVEKHMFLKMPCTFGEAAIAMLATLRHQCRLSEAKRSLMLCGFKRLARWFQGCVDLTRSADFWASNSHLRLPDIVGPSGRRRRLPFAMKAFVFSEVTQASALKSSAQAVAGAMAVARKDPKALVDKKTANNRSKNASKFSRDVMIGYLHRSREVNAGHIHANIQLDGSTFSGLDLELFAFWNPHRQIGCWLPPMDLRWSVSRATYHLVARGRIPGGNLSFWPRRIRPMESQICPFRR